MSAPASSMIADALKELERAHVTLTSLNEAKSVSTKEDGRVEVQCDERVRVGLQPSLRACPQSCPLMTHPIAATTSSSADVFPRSHYPAASGGDDG